MKNLLDPTILTHYFSKSSVEQWIYMDETSETG